MALSINRHSLSLTCNQLTGETILSFMDEKKYCLKHSCIETKESCIRCKAPLCPDCRIKNEEQTYCSNWCRFHDKVNHSIKTYANDINFRKTEGTERLVFLSNLIIIMIVFSFTASALYFFEDKHNRPSAIVATKPETAKMQETIIVKKSLKKPSVLPRLMEEPKNKTIRTSLLSAKKSIEKEAEPVRKERISHWPQNIKRVVKAGKKISITFDGGSSDSSAEAILNILLERNIKTTFFLTGKFIKRYPQLVRRMLKEGHEIGNHTYSHPHLTTYSSNRRNETSGKINFKKLKAELEKTAALYYKLTGEKMAPFWRAPYGEINNDILSWASNVGYQHIAWTVDYKAKKSMDSLDWVADKNSSLYLSGEEIKERLLSFADDRGRAKGGIILMHLGTERKNDAAHNKLGEIIDDFTVKGYELVPISKLVKAINRGSVLNKL